MYNQRELGKDTKEYKEVKELWEEFAQEIKYKNRFWCGYNIDKSDSNDNKLIDEIAKLLDEIASSEWIEHSLPMTYENTPINKYSPLYRARKGNYVDKKDEEMGAPVSIENMSAGRMNPIGISYLYLAEDPYTALIEKRVCKDDIITIAEFISDEYIEITNLALIKETAKDNCIGSEKTSDRAIHLASILNEYFSKQISGTAEIEYLPCQFVAEYFRLRGKQGISYKSSVGTGRNYVIFDKEKFHIQAKQLCKVKEVNEKCIKVEDSDKQ